MSNPMTAGYNLPPEPADDPSEDWIADRTAELEDEGIDPEDAWEIARGEWFERLQDRAEAYAEDLYYD